MVATKSPDETFELARKFASRLRRGDVLALVGELGAGKTCFVQGLAGGLGVPKNSYVRSPSFTLMNEYWGGRLVLYHFDFYRLTNPSDIDDLGIEEYIEGDGVTVIEWADRFPGVLPRNAIHIEFRIIGEPPSPLPSPLRGEGRMRGGFEMSSREIIFKKKYATKLGKGR